MGRATTLLVGLILLAFARASVAHAADAAPAVAAEGAPPAPSRRLQLGVQFLPMPLGELNATRAGITVEAESRFAYGAGLSVGYEVISGLVLGIAPQIIFEAKPRAETGAAEHEYDLLARVAYRYAFPGVAAVYAEVLPGYSLYKPVDSDTSKGFVLAGGVGCEIDLSERLYANAGLGYQKGWQNQNATSNYRTSFVRVALGVGARF